VCERRCIYGFYDKYWEKANGQRKAEEKEYKHRIRMNGETGEDKAQETQDK